MSPAGRGLSKSVPGGTMLGHGQSHLRVLALHLERPGDGPLEAGHREGQSRVMQEPKRAHEDKLHLDDKG